MQITKRNDERQPHTQSVKEISDLGICVLYIIRKFYTVERMCGRAKAVNSIGRPISSDEETTPSTKLVLPSLLCSIIYIYILYINFFDNKLKK